MSLNSGIFVPLTGGLVPPIPIRGHIGGCVPLNARRSLCRTHWRKSVPRFLEALCTPIPVRRLIGGCVPLNSWRLCAPSPLQNSFEELLDDLCHSILGGFMPPQWRTCASKCLEILCRGIDFFNSTSPYSTGFN